MKGRILLVNGPNLNMLGTREPDRYGLKKLSEITEDAARQAAGLGFKLDCFQSNSEGEIIDFIQKEGRDADGLVINAGAFPHTSIAIRDALLSVKIPFVEVHLSNIFAREDFRRVSYLSDAAVGMVTGFGPASYTLGIAGIIDFIKNKG